MNRVTTWFFDIIITALALWVASALIPGIEVTPPAEPMVGDGQNDRMLTFLGVAVVFLLVNAVVKPVLDLLGMPITCITLGLFALVINAAVFAITAWASNQFGLGLTISGFWPALFGAAIIAIVRGLLVMPQRNRSDR
ncbi:phage holin family protein [Corynebacterium breve]|uniref:Phage holin family protein n=1 Tax=Corynebacterium breve TaxID=3049799 RepID=A0ABY8VEX6_9CORY|nr:phage holin family protein [Corynebacterium breve]WIM67887.1 phage holin family protein [Corynebacterium breve]